MRTKVSRFVALLLGVVCCCLSLTACQGNSDASDGVRTDVVYCITSDVESMDPTATTDQIANVLFRQLYDPLVAKDKDGNFVPRLIKSWDISSDFLTYTFHLRDEDVFFHDGSKVTAEDVAFSINRCISSAVMKPVMVNMIEAVVVDEKTVDLKLSAPYAATLQLLCDKGRVLSANTTDFENNPIGTGPYKFVSRRSGENLVLTAFDSYYRGEPAIKDITFKIITDTTTQVAALQAGEIDFLTHANLSVAKSVKDDSDLVWHQVNFRGQVYIIMNNQQAPFDDINVRKAVQYGIDMDTMLLGGSEGMGKVMNTFWPEMVVASPEAGYTPPYAYDLDKATEYLNNYKTAKGIKNLDITILAPDTAVYLNPATTMMGLLQKVGFNVTLNQVDRATFFAAAAAGSYEIAVIGTSWPVPDADALLAYNHSSGNPLSRYYTPFTDSLWEDARAENDTEKRRELYRSIQEYIDENACQIPLYQYDSAVAYSAKLKGVDTQNDMYEHFVFDWSWE